MKVSWSAVEKWSRRWKQGVLTPLQLLWVDSRVSSDQIWLKVWLFHFLRTHIWCLSLGTKVEIFLSTHAKSWSTNVKLHKWTDTIDYSMQHILFLIWFLQHGHMYFIIGTFVFFSNWGSYYFFCRIPNKVHIFWEGHKILRNIHYRFDRYYIGQIYGGDFTEFCGLLRIYEL